MPAPESERQSIDKTRAFSASAVEPGTNADGTPVGACFSPDGVVSGLDMKITLPGTARIPPQKNL